MMVAVLSSPARGARANNAIRSGTSSFLLLFVITSSLVLFLPPSVLSEELESSITTTNVESESSSWTHVRRDYDSVNNYESSKNVPGERTLTEDMEDKSNSRGSVPNGNVDVQAPFCQKERTENEESLLSPHLRGGWWPWGGGGNETTPAPTPPPTAKPDDNGGGGDNDGGNSDNDNDNDKKKKKRRWWWPWGGRGDNNDDDNNDDSDDDGKHKQDKKKDKSCAGHKTCTECSLASSLCHWCQHDESCHAIGSIYGCLTGVDCYSNDRCQRSDPEPVHEIVFTEIGPGPLLIILAVGGIALCCATIGFAGAGAVKGAYDDLATLTVTAASASSRGGHASNNETKTDARPLTKRRRHRRTRRSRRVHDDEGIHDEVDAESEMSPLVPIAEKDGEEQTSLAQEANDEKQPLTETTSDLHRSKGRAAPSNDHDRVDDEFAVEEWWTKDEEGRRSNQDYTRLQDDSPENEYGTALQVGLNSRDCPYKSSGSRHMACMYNACKICYIITVAIIALFVIFSIRYFPKYPEYNVCSDSVAWKSIVDSMASLKVQASFQILFSVFNPNHIDVMLDLGSGSFKHYGVQVGTFEIPPSDVKAMSITDILVTATFMPDKWEALSLTSEYYRGTLIFKVDTQATVEMPDLMNYSFKTEFDDVTVHINDPRYTDRHLCACPQWKDVKNKTKVMELSY